MRPLSADNLDTALLRRIEGEFLEMPGLVLTAAQAQRLWALDRDLCHTVLERLVERKFLGRTSRGLFVRLDAR